MEKAYVKIEADKNDCICHAVDYNYKKLWMQEPEAKMINPNSIIWWWTETIGCPIHSHEARQARLLGIAMMLTMPEDMINEQFKTGKK